MQSTNLKIQFEKQIRSLMLCSLAEGKNDLSLLVVVKYSLLFQLNFYNGMKCNLVLSSIYKGVLNIINMG